MRSGSSFIRFFCVGLMLFIASCIVDGSILDGKPCDADGDCAEGFVCVAQQCLRPEDNEVIEVDEDGDGFALFNECGLLNENGIDCDDQDATTYPGAEELPGDGID